MKPIIFIFAALLSSLLSAQSVDWFETIGVHYSTSSSTVPFGISALVADDSVLYVGGAASYVNFINFYRSDDSVAMGNTTCCRASNFIAQYTADGRFRWARPVGSRTGFSYQKMAMRAHKGAVYTATLLMESGLVGKDTLVNQTGTSILLVKFDKEGREVWRNISSSVYWSSDIELGQLMVDDNENVYLSGEKTAKFRTLSFDNVSTPPKTMQFVFRFDAKGKAQQAYGLQEVQEGVWNMRVKGMQTDGKGTAYLLLNSGGRNVSSSCAYSQWRTDIFQLASTGGIKRVATFNCDDLLSASSLGRAENGDLLVAGRYRGTISIGRWQSPVVPCQRMMGFVMRLSVDGQLIWFKDSPIKLDFSDNYDLLREKDGNWLVAGVQQYNVANPDISHKYPNVDDKYPKGKSRIIIRRLSPMGVQLDSVAYYNAGFEEQFNGLFLAQNSRKTYLAGLYECYFDSLSLSSCSNRFFQEGAGDKIFIAQVSDKVLKNKTLPVSTTPPSVFSLLPNPTEGYLQIRTAKPLDTDADLTISDISGRLVLQRLLLRGQFIQTVNLSDLPNGVYIVRIKEKDAVLVTKITKI
jgi:Secretion system C-terminal sorting domain